MSVKIKIISAVLMCALLFSLSACAVRLDPPREMTAEEEATNMGFSACEYDGVVEVGSYKRLKVNIKLDYEDEVKWSTADPETAVVDSNGRVDGIKVGKTVITATAKNATIEYPIEIVKAGKATTSYSTAITDNFEAAKANLGDSEGVNPYAIIVNEYNCNVTVFTYNSKGIYSLPVRSMVCSTAKSPLVPFKDYYSTDDDEVDLTIYENIGDKSEWVYLSDGNYYRYATYIGEDMMFQSSPYTKEDEASLNAEEYNKIGTPATAKNIRLSVADAKWIYDNCKEGTQVRIVNSNDTYRFSRLGVPESIKLTENSKSLKYDPTDASKNNPYTKLKPVISGADDVMVEVEKGFDLYSGVTAVDTCGNDITSKIKVDGDFDRNVEGRYVITYYATDAMGRTARVDREITVVEDLSEYTTTPLAE